jgi:hypothetical protein
MEIPSKEYLASKLKTRKASKRSLRRQRMVLTSKLTREHIRLLFKHKLNSIKDENSFKSPA